jgi:hypothetical protein
MAMSELKGIVGELRATVHVTRKATGKVETYEVVGGVTQEQADKILGKRHHGTAGAMVGPGSDLNNAQE